jgi:hypothetical protein
LPALPLETLGMSYESDVERVSHTRSTASRLQTIVIRLKVRAITDYDSFLHLQCKAMRVDFLFSRKNKKCKGEDSVYASKF